MIRSMVNKRAKQWLRSPGFRHLFRTIELPESLDDVITRNVRSECSADSTQLDPQLVEAIWSSVERLYATAYYPAIHFCLRHKGKILFNRAIGHASGNEPGVLDSEKKILAKPSTPACLFSSSKAITAALVHKAAEEGYVNLLDPISHYIPEFGRHGKDRITIYQLLSHRAGIPGVEEGTPADIIFNHQACVDLLCDAKPTDERGRNQAYHAVTGGFILRELLQRTTGRDIRDYWDEKFKKPMGFKVFDFGADDAVYASMSRDSATGARLPGVIDKFFEKSIGSGLDDAMALISERRFFSEPIPAANMVATAEEVSRFYQMLLDQGKYKRQQILDPVTVHRLTWETGPHKLDNALKIPMRFSPGMMMGGSPYGIFGRNSTNAYGHLGLLNTLTWADPDRDISVAMITTGKPVIAHNLPSLIRVLNAITAIPMSE